MVYNQLAFTIEFYCTEIKHAIIWLIIMGWWVGKLI